MGRLLSHDYREVAGMTLQAGVLFDLDGVLIESDTAWAEVREGYVRTHGGRWHARAEHDMQGMSSSEWASYVATQLGVPVAPGVIAHEVAEQLKNRYRRTPPLVPGAQEVTTRLATHWTLALASSSNRVLIDLILADEHLARAFSARVSSEEVQFGKPAPDVYQEAARRLGVDPRHCVAVEDSVNGMRAALAAGCEVIVIPSSNYGPDADLLLQAAAVIPSLTDLTPELVRSVLSGRRDEQATSSAKRTAPSS